jgi:hypothetical protein
MITIFALAVRKRRAFSIELIEMLISSACGLLGKVDVALFRPALRFVAQVGGQAALEEMAINDIAHRPQP